MNEFFLDECFMPFPKSPCDSLQSEDSLDKLYMTISEGKKKKFVCTFSDCQKVFRFKSEIERHVSAHSESRPHVCTFEKCKKSFKRLDALENHVRSQHTGEAPLVCPYPHCGLRFTTNAKLRYHMILHKGTKPYKCSIPGCERAFVTLSQLKQHERSILVHKKLSIGIGQKDQELSECLSSPTTNDSLLEQSKVFVPEEVIRKKLKYDFERRIYNKTLSIEEDTNDYANLDGIVKIEPHLNQIDLNSQYKGKEGFLKHVITENEALKGKLETSEKLLMAMREQMNRVANFLPQEFQKLVMPEWDSKIFLQRPEVQETSNFSSTKDVDSYFFENDNPKLEFFSECHITRAESFEERSSDKEEDLFTNINFENFPSLLLK